MDYFDFENIERFKIYRDASVPKENDKGEKVIAWQLEDKIIVHPDNWLEFIEKMTEIASKIEDVND